MPARTPLAIAIVVAIAILTLFVNPAIEIFLNGNSIGSRGELNFIEGNNVTITAVDNTSTESIDITINAATSTATSSVAGVGAFSTQENNVEVVASTTALDFGDCFDVTPDGVNEADITLDFSESCGTLDISDDTNLAATAPITLTGDTVGVTQNAGTDITTNLEEETHAAEHDITGNDTTPFVGVIRDDGTDVTRRRNLNFVGAGITCVDVGGTTSTDCTVGGGGGGGSISTKENNVSVLVTTTAMDFQNCFDVVDVGGNEADISFDFTENCGAIDDLTDVLLSGTSSADILLSNGQWINVGVSGDATLAVSGALTVGTSTRFRVDPTNCTSAPNLYAQGVDETGIAQGCVDLLEETELDTKAELQTQITDVTDFAEADGDTFTGVQDFGGSTSLELPTCASVPNANGEICTRTATSTSELIWFQDELHILSGTTTKGFLLFSATSTDDFLMLWIDGGNAALTKVCMLAEGGTNVILSINQFDQNGDSPVSLMSGDMTAVAGTRSCTGESGEPTVNTNTIVNQNGIGPVTTSVSGTNTTLMVQLYLKWIL